MTTDQQTGETKAETEEAYAAGWKPEPGQRLVGTVIDIAATDMGYGVYPIVTLKTASGEVAVHAFHTVLRRELARRRPTIGDDLDITYLGKKSDGGIGSRGYDMYRVRSSKDVQGYDWSRDLPDGDEGDSQPTEPPIDPAPIAAHHDTPTEPQAAADAVADGDDLPF